MSTPPPDAIVPDFFEQWSWEGDTSVLPFKWRSGLEECGLENSAPELSRPWESANFDPNSIFFLTQRSQTAGGALLLPSLREDQSLVAVLWVHPNHRRTGVGRCLLRLCLHRAWQLHRRRVSCDLSLAAAVGCCSQSAMTMLLESEGFQRSA